VEATVSNEFEPEKDLFSTAEAARYLGLSLATVKYHIHTMGNLKPDAKVGPALVFRRTTLDRFLKEKRGPGRPKQNVSDD
jgi:hypothetical protein